MIGSEDCMAMQLSALLSPREYHAIQKNMPERKF